MARLEGKPNETAVEPSGVTSQANDSSRRSFLKGTVLAATTVAAAELGGLTSSGAAQEKMLTPQESQRGSEKLLEKLGAAGRTYSLQDLKQVIAIAKKHNVKVVNWCQYGQPAVDGVCGTFDVRPALVGVVLQDLLRLEAVLRFRIGVFPIGIPAVDVVRVNFAAGRAGVEGGIIVDL